MIYKILSGRHLVGTLILFMLLTPAACPEDKTPVLIISDSIKNKSARFQKLFNDAEARIKTFAGIYGWQKCTEKPFVDRIEIYDTKDGYDSRLKQLCPEIKGQTIPKTFVAGIEKRVFFSVSPKIYEEVYPAGKDKDAFEKLIAHELGHRLHVRILNGEEEKMGPIWFFEGFATYASQQFPENKPDLSVDEIRALLKEKKRGSYVKYNKLIKYFLKRHDLKELVEQAGRSDFSDWLLKRNDLESYNPRQ